MSHERRPDLDILVQRCFECRSTFFERRANRELSMNCKGVISVKIVIVSLYATQIGI